MAQGDHSHVTLIGTVQPRDAETRFTPNGTQVATFRFVVGRSKRTAEGSWEDESDWYQVTAFGRTAEKVAEQALKGTRLCVMGRLSHRPWTNASGVERMSIEVTADSVIPLGERYRKSDAASSSQTSASYDSDDLDSVPF